MFVSDTNTDARILADLLKVCPFGETVTWADMSSVLGRDAREYRWRLYAAFRLTQREDGAVFSRIQGIGYRRLSPGEIHLIGQTARTRIRNTARRGSRALVAGAKGCNLSEDEQKAVSREQAALGIFEHLARDRNLSAEPAKAEPYSVSAKKMLAALGHAVE
jgi:hypothetical protein